MGDRLDSARFYLNSGGFSDCLCYNGCMILILDRKATEEEIEQMVKDLNGYIKVVVDIEKRILAGGGKRYVDGEQLLRQIGSKQENLWGGGIDMETKEIDYNSMINIRPRQNNASRDIMSLKVRGMFDKVIKKTFL